MTKTLKIPGLAQFLHQVQKLADKSEAATERFSRATGEKAAELAEEYEQFQTTLEVLAGLIESIGSDLGELVDLHSQYDDLEREDKEDARGEIAEKLESLQEQLTMIEGALEGQP